MSKLPFWHCFRLASFFAFLLFFFFVAGGCGDDPVVPPTPDIDWDTVVYNPSPYTINVPDYFPTLPQPSGNTTTVEGVALGRMLFYDPILSGDSTQACASCHALPYGMSDNGKQFSTGIDQIAGNRNAMALFNLAYNTRFFWDGAETSLEAQALKPVTNPIEMHEEWDDAVDKLMNNTHYKWRFYKAFGVKTITPAEVTKAIAQFERSIVTANSKYDRAIQPGSGVFLSDLEAEGYELFRTEGADCFHCHSLSAHLFGDNELRNNGLNEAQNPNDFPDKGLGGVTNNPNDMGKFKTPSLRNIELTAPYMHDGRFATLEEVVDHYSHGVKPSPTLDNIMATKFGTGKNFTPEQKQALIAFLKTLTDQDFANNTAQFGSPF